MHITDHRSRFLEETCGGGVVPETSSALLRLSELEVTTWSPFQGMAGIDHRTAIVNRPQALQPNGARIALKCLKNSQALGMAIKASVVGESQFICW